MQADGDAVTDSNPHLASCCQLLELLLRKGLQRYCRLSALSLAVEQTKACKKLISAQGRGRFLLRLALSRKILPQFITHLLHTPRVLESNSNCHLSEPFMSLLLVLSHKEFKLVMENCSFLDESWLLPVYETYDVVPCRDVGLVLRYLRGRVFVLDLTPGSQADFDKFICRGDVIDEINGTSLRNSKSGQAGVVLSQLKGCPLSLSVVRWKAQDGTVFRPLIKLLQLLRMENPDLQLGPTPPQHPSSKGQISSPTQCLKEGRQTILSFCEDLFVHHYPEISCVGRLNQPDYTIFAFCVADSPETPLSTGFCCVVLRARTIKECEEIVCRIATGFKHTEWFV
uniref:PDZ domain-containing protein n=1 Tax=Takifugu rubripes TaxID=31033 RepID=A0A3B5KHA8_TAKRU